MLIDSRLKFAFSNMFGASATSLHISGYAIIPKTFSSPYISCFCLGRVRTRAIFTWVSGKLRIDPGRKSSVNTFFQTGE